MSLFTSRLWILTLTRQVVLGSNKDEATMGFETGELLTPEHVALNSEPYTPETVNNEPLTRTPHPRQSARQPYLSKRKRNGTRLVQKPN